MTSISNESELIAWGSTGTVGTLTHNITLTTNTGFPISLANNSVLNGNGFTLTLMNGNTGGLFSFGADNLTVTIEQLLIDADAITNVDFESGLLFSDTHDRTGTDLTIANCGVFGTFSLDWYGGTFIGRTKTDAVYNIYIHGCYTTVTATKTGGGIVGYDAGLGDGSILIENCYSTGEIRNSGGGIAGSYFGRYNTSSAIIRNCYSTGDIFSPNSGGICGTGAGDSATNPYIIENCYSSGTLGDFTGGICGASGSSNGNVINCFSKYATTTGVGSKHFFGHGGTIPSVTNCKAGNGTWNAVLGEELTSDAIWYDDNSFSTGFGLKSFSTNIWDINLSYTSNTSLANFANKSLFADNISFSELTDRGVTLFTLRDLYEITATKLPFAVYLYTSFGRSAIFKQGSATPGE